VKSPQEVRGLFRKLKYFTKQQSKYQKQPTWINNYALG
jgi:hypothetical protein